MEGSGYSKAQYEVAAICGIDMERLPRVDVAKCREMQDGDLNCVMQGLSAIAGAWSGEGKQEGSGQGLDGSKYGGG